MLSFFILGGEFLQLQRAPLLPAGQMSTVLRIFLWHCCFLRTEPVCSVGRAFRDKVYLFPWPLPPIATYLLTRRYLKWPLAPIRQGFSFELMKVPHKNSINLSAVYDASKTLDNTSDYGASVLHELFQSQPTAL